MGLTIIIIARQIPLSSLFVCNLFGLKFSQFSITLLNFLYPEFAEGLNYTPNFDYFLVFSKSFLNSAFSTSLQERAELKETSLSLLKNLTAFL